MPYEQLWFWPSFIVHMIESSLSGLKGTVRTKLNLPSDTFIRLAQLRHGAVIDLEDGVLVLVAAACRFTQRTDDDFDAFCAAAHMDLVVDVQVTLTEHNPITGDVRFYYFTFDDIPPIVP